MKMIRCIVSDIVKSPTSIRSEIPSLALGAILIYMCNALIYRPAEGSSETQLLEGACRHQLVEEKGGVLPVLYGDGLYFICGFAPASGSAVSGYSSPPSLATVHRLDPSKLSTGQYRRDSYAALLLCLQPVEPSQPRPKRPTAPSSVATPAETIAQITDADNNGTLSDSDGDDPDNEFEREFPNEVLAIQAYAQHYEISDQNLDLLCRITRAFPNDLLQNFAAKRAHSHVVEELKTLKNPMEMFRRCRLADIFFSAQYKEVLVKDWKGLFDTFFPADEETCQSRFEGRKQWGSISYLHLWRRSFPNDNGPTDRHALRACLWAWFRQLNWLPHAPADRPWKCKSPSSQWQLVETGTQISGNPYELYVNRQAYFTYLDELEERSLPTSLLLEKMTLEDK